MTSLSFAGISVVGDQVRPPRPASATTAVTYSGYHLLVVNGYSSLVKDIPNGEFTESRQFKVGGYRWTLHCYPNDYEPDHGDYMSFVLFLDQGNVVDPVMVQYEFSFVADQVLNYDPPLLAHAKQTRKFCSREPYSYTCSTRRGIFEKSENLKNGSFTIRCDIVITKDVNINEAGGTVPVSNVLPPPDIGQDLGELLQSGIGTDVTFQVGGGTFMAHRCVLAARSAVFKAQLFGPMKEGTTTSVIHIRDMEEQVFRLLLEFIYCDSISVPEIDDTEEEAITWQCLLEAADRYDLPRLTLMCELVLCAHINTSTVPTILALAEQHHCRVLKEACLGFLTSPANLQHVMALDGLEPLVSSCPSVLKDLIGILASLKVDANTADSGTAAQLPVIDIPESDMHLHFSSLLQSEERTDVTFQVGGETLRAHRCVLAARSSVFRDELFGPMVDRASDVICINGMEARVFKLLLTFIYSDSVPEMSEEEKEEVEGNKDDADVMWQQLLVAADRYGIQRLRLMCEIKLGRYINTNTVATILALAEQHNCQRLKDECLDFLDIPAHLKQVMAAGGLDHLRSICPSVLIDLIVKLASL